MLNIGKSSSVYENILNPGKTTWNPRGFTISRKLYGTKVYVPLKYGGVYSSLLPSKIFPKILQTYIFYNLLEN